MASSGEGIRGAGEEFTAENGVDAAHFHLPSGAQHEGTRLQSVRIDGEYDPGDLQEIDKAIRHMPSVVAYCVKKAQECIRATGAEEHFVVVLQNEPRTQRPRAYCAPNTSEGIRLELEQGVLLKAAVSMEGK